MAPLMLERLDQEAARGLRLLAAPHDQERASGARSGGEVVAGSAAPLLRAGQDAAVGLALLGREAKRRWWDYAIVLVATGVFVALGVRAVVPPLAMDFRWVGILALVLVASLAAGAWSLWNRTRFS